MSSLFCCSSISPFRPQYVDHESKFKAFVQWAKQEPAPASDSTLVAKSPYAIQLVRQVNYGPQESIRYFVPCGGLSDFKEVSEDALLQENFEKVNSYKNFRCARHSKFFEVNLYQKNATNAHHWRANLARPSRDIDLAFRPASNTTVTTATAATSVVAPVESKEEDDSPPTGLKTTAVQPSTATGGNQDSERTATGATSKHHSAAGGIGPAATKMALQLLLPNLQGVLFPGSPRPTSRNTIMMLLCLDKVNTDLSLDLEFDQLWERVLDAPGNLAEFFRDCISLEAGRKVDDDIERIDTFLVELFERFGKSDSASVMPRGRARLQDFVRTVLADARSENLDWAVQWGHLVEKVIKSGPSDHLVRKLVLDTDLGSIRVKTEVREQTENPGHHEESSRKKEDKRVIKGVDGDDSGEDHDDYCPYDDDDDFRYSYYREPSMSPMQDFTACDKECGYCGNCDY